MSSYCIIDGLLCLHNVVVKQTIFAQRIFDNDNINNFDDSDWSASEFKKKTEQKPAFSSNSFDDDEFFFPSHFDSQ